MTKQCPECGKFIPYCQVRCSVCRIIRHKKYESTKVICITCKHVRVPEGTAQCDNCIIKSQVDICVLKYKDDILTSTAKAAFGIITCALNEKPVTQTQVKDILSIIMGVVNDE